MLLSSLALYGRLPLLAPEGDGGGGSGGSGGGNHDGGGGNGSGAGNNGGNAGGSSGSGGGDGGFKAITTQEDFDAAIKDRLSRQERTLRQSITDQVKADLKADADAAAEQARKDRERQQEIDRGEFDKARTSLESERDAAKGEATSLKAENDQLREAMKAGVEARWNELPDRVKKVGEKQHPDDDVLGRWTYLNDPDTVEWVKELTASGATGNGTNKGNPPGPNPAGPIGEKLTSPIRGRQITG